MCLFVVVADVKRRVEGVGQGRRWASFCMIIIAWDMGFPAMHAGGRDKNARRRWEAGTREF